MNSYSQQVKFMSQNGYKVDEIKKYLSAELKCVNREISRFQKNFMLKDEEPNDEYVELLNNQSLIKDLLDEYSKENLFSNIKNKILHPLLSENVKRDSSCILECTTRKEINDAIHIIVGKVPEYKQESYETELRDAINRGDAELINSVIDKYEKTLDDIIYGNNSYNNITAEPIGQLDLSASIDKIISEASKELRNESVSKTNRQYSGPEI